MLAIAQCFGQMPVTGLRQTQPLAFRWRTMRALNAVVYLVLSGGVALLYLRQISRQGINARNIGEWGVVPV